MTEQHDWSGDFDGYLAFAEKNNPFNPQWCPKHWAPCPVQGKLGMLATVLLMGESFALIPDGVSSASALNSWWANQTVPACCQLGEEKMDFLWRFVDWTQTDVPCKAMPTPFVKAFRGRHVCWFVKDHRGPHDWQQKPRSIFDYEMPEAA